MSDDDFVRKVLARAGMDRRAFLKRFVGTGLVFAAPAVLSFDMGTAGTPSFPAMSSNSGVGGGVSSNASPGGNQPPAPPTDKGSGCSGH